MGCTQGWRIKVNGLTQNDNSPVYQRLSYQLVPNGVQYTKKSMRDWQTMALLPALRHLLNDICRAASSSSSSCSTRPTTAISSLFPYYTSIPNSNKLSLHFPPSPKSTRTLIKPHLTPQENALLLTRDERLGPDPVVAACSSTIAAIVTSLGGPPAAVGIVRLSGPSAVSIVARVFRPATKKKEKKRKTSDWQPKSHVVEYGVVLDCHENVIDEVHFKIPCVVHSNFI